ncbi:hypothetical protein SKAU_G00069760 [Synaphobranchus kaupii]|uniref:Uncharacterized protein n=1 Tax=Synaphobranchus kaupii TaxID=118154 RepID=A0A9Q1JAE5_SYNKA|nr:hypothetical protein SKAU_G00069760 [Synaphobranchus kaupii]
MGDFRAKGPGWKRAQEMSWLAHLPHVLYKESWEHKRFLKSKVGPGSYRIADFTELLLRRPQSVRGVCESREERFKSFNAKNGTPGPGSYGKGGIPSAVQDEKRMQLTGTCPTMDFSPAVERLLEAKRDCGLGPGTYNLKSSTDLLLNRRCDHKSIPSGHLPSPKISNVDPSEQIRCVSLCVKELERPEKKKHGLFSKMRRNPECPTERIYHSTLAQCPRPAVSTALTKPPLSQNCSPSVNQDPPPFLSSVPRISEGQERLHNGNNNNCMLGPGTYKIGNKDQRTTLHSHQSAFKSRTQRYLHNPERDKFNQERLQPMHFPVNKGSYLENNNTSSH